MRLFAALLLSGTLLSSGMSKSSVAPSDWNRQTFASGTYQILAPRVDGRANLVNSQQFQTIVRALGNDSAGAIKRRYPGAKFTQQSMPGAIRVTPVLVAPPALLPWAKLRARLDLQLPGGTQVSVGQSFTLLTLWQQGGEAANYAFDQVALQLP